MRSVSWLSGLLISVLWVLPAFAASPPAQPLAIFNQSPLQLIFGLPAANGPKLLTNGRQQLDFTVDYSSHFVNKSAPGEALLLDGETTRAALTYRRGLVRGLEVRVEVPFIDHSGGFFDSTLNEFHDITSAGDGGRANAPDDRQLYAYNRNGQPVFRVDDSPSGLGDIRVSLAQTLNLSTTTLTSVHAQLKLPTGDADELTGSEGLDFAAWASAGRNNIAFQGFSVTGAVGGLYTATGDVLPDQRRQGAGFGWLTLGYDWSHRFILKAQAYAHSPLYKNSNLDSLNKVTVQGAAGFEWGFSPVTRLDFSIVEDLSEDASPDVSFNLALRRRF